MFVIKCSMLIKISLLLFIESENEKERNIVKMFVASCFCEFGWMDV